MSKEFRIGIVAVISGLIMYYGFSYLKGSDFLAKTSYYYAVYNNVGSLTKSNPVKINGVPVGKVNRITLLTQDGNKVLVEFDVQDDVVLGASTVAELTSDLLGGTSIVLRIGEVSTPKMIGDTITSTIDKGLAEIIESAQPVANNLNITINKLNKILGEFEGIGGSVKQSLANLDSTMITINALLIANQGKVNELIGNTNILVESINSRVAQLEPILAKTAVVMDSLDAADIGQAIAEIQELMATTNNLVKNISAGEGTIGKLVTSDSLHNNLTKTLYDLDQLLIHFNNYPKDFLKPLGRKNSKLKGVETSSN